MLFTCILQVPTHLQWAAVPPNPHLVRCHIRNLKCCTHLWLIPSDSSTRRVSASRCLFPHVEMRLITISSRTPSTMVLSGARGQECECFLTRTFCQMCIAAVNSHADDGQTPAEGGPDPPPQVRWDVQLPPHHLPAGHPQHIIQPCCASVSPSVRRR